MSVVRAEAENMCSARVFRLLTDTVEKVENRTAPKISRKLILGRLDRCNAPQRRYEDRWLFLCETKWSLTSPRAKRISGPKKFRSSAGKDFFNGIDPLRTSA